jgi:hypothetical protein
MSQTACRGCGNPVDHSTPDPLCLACREQISTWHNEQRLADKAQQGFEEAMGMRPQTNEYPDLPDDAGLRAERWKAGTGMAPQQILGVSGEGVPWVSEGRWDSATGADPVLEGQIRCRHCAAVLTATDDDFWTDPAGSAACPEIGIPHLPMPEGMTGGQ